MKGSLMKAKLEIVNESGEELELPQLSAIVDTLWEQEQIRDYYEISLLLVDDEAMSQMNQNYRGKASPTDVLSFINKTPSRQDNKGIETYLCDIVIDINYILRQKGSNNFKTEFGIVFIHAVLHILGYDHIRKSDKELMESKEQYYQDLLQGLI